jgi:EAL domain-containing protein (putative c-di-GMP-specific phosphodiesterase class I)
MHSAELVDAFTRLAHHLGMKVVVEGIETEHQRDIVRDLGCDYAQGYLWADAVPAAVLASMGGRRAPGGDRFSEGGRRAT